MSGGGNGGYDPKALGQKFGTKLGAELDKPPAVFDRPLYAGVGPSTQAGWNSLYGTANNPAYSNGIQGAIGSYADTAAGKNLGVEAPGYRAVRDRLRDDVMTDVGSQFTASGRFGGGSHRDSLASGLVSSLGALDMSQYQSGLDRQERAAGMLPGLYSASQQPAQTRLAVGQMQDADSQARLLGENDLFRRRNDTGRQNLLELLGGFTGSQGNAGMGEEQPWWQSLLGLGLQAL